MPRLACLILPLAVGGPARALAAGAAPAEADWLSRVLILAAGWALLAAAVELVLRALGGSAASALRTRWTLAALLPAYLLWRTLSGGAAADLSGRLFPVLCAAALIAACEAAAGAFGAARPWRVRLRLAAAAGLLTEMVRRLVVADVLDALTGLLLLCACGSWLLLLLAFLPARLAPLRANLRLLLVSVVLLVGGAELVLRFGVDRYASYLERTGAGRYVRVYRAAPGLRVHPVGRERMIRSEEFVHRRRVSSLGIPEREIPLARAASEQRILALGDSFTEGVGAPYEASWVAVMERELTARLPRATVTAVNAGVNGSDACAAYALLEQRLLPLGPDVVVLAINTSDVVDVILRGGIERFEPEASPRPRRGPRWEWLYGTSHLVRHVVHDLLGYNRLLLRPRAMQAAEARALVALRDAVAAFERLSREQGYGLLVVIHPQRGEVEGNAYQYDLPSLLRGLPTREGLATLDLLAYFLSSGSMSAASAADFYWPLDSHHNPGGYALMGRTVAQRILVTGLLSASAGRVGQAESPTQH